MQPQTPRPFARYSRYNPYNARAQSRPGGFEPQFVANNKRPVSVSPAPPVLPSNNSHFPSAPRPSYAQSVGFIAQDGASSCSKTNGFVSSFKVNTAGQSLNRLPSRLGFDRVGRPPNQQPTQGSIIPPKFTFNKSNTSSAFQCSSSQVPSQPAVVPVASTVTLSFEKQQEIVMLAMKAIEQGPQCEVIEALTRRHPFIIYEIASCEGWAFHQHTLLSFAISKCRMEIVDFLLKIGSSTLVAAFGTVLHVAVSFSTDEDPSITIEQRCSMVKRLLKLPPNNLHINYLDKQKKTAAYLAVEKERYEILCIMLARCAHRHRVNQYLVDSEGRTLLHVAASLKSQNSHRFLERLLRLFPVDLVNAQCCADKQTPLHLAVYNKQTASVNALLRKGANASVTNAYGETPLHYAFFRPFPEIILLLLEKGAAVDAQDDNGDTPLHFALRQYQFQTAQTKQSASEQQCNELLSLQLDVANPAMVKVDDIFNACKNERLAIICCLLLRRPNIALPNDKGQQPLQLIRELPKQLQDTLLAIYVCSHGRCTCQNWADTRFLPCNCVVFCKECCSKLTASQCSRCNQEIKRKTNIVTNTDFLQFVAPTVAPAAASVNPVAPAGSTSAAEDRYFSCNICLEIFQRVAGLNVALRCGHMFHRYCLNRAQLNTLETACDLCRERAGPRKRLCPTCRKHICNGTELLLFP